MVLLFSLSYLGQLHLTSHLSSHWTWKHNQQTILIESSRKEQSEQDPGFFFKRSPVYSTQP